MGYYDTQQVCLNGHQITANIHQSPELRKDFCNICGEKTIYTCPKCKSEIRGIHHVEGVFMVFPTIVPDYCHKCGTPYPWTEKRKRKGSGRLLEHDSKDPLNSIERICMRFHLIAKQIRSRHDDRATLDIKDEYDVQDFLHSLLRLFFDDIRTEEWTPSYAGSSSRMDFLLKKESIVIEVKKTREKLCNKEIGEQLIVDIEKYRTHPSCNTLVCFLYDPDSRITNPHGLERDLCRNENNFAVKVFIVPKGY